MKYLILSVLLVVALVIMAVTNVENPMKNKFEIVCSYPRQESVTLNKKLAQLETQQNIINVSAPVLIPNQNGDDFNVICVTVTKQE